MPIQKLTKGIVEAAILGFHEQKKKLDAQIADMHALLPGGESTPNGAGSRRRRISAAGRKAIARAQRKRWAEKRAQSGETAAAKPKRKLSAAGRAAISAAAKKRWAARKAVR